MITTCHDMFGFNNKSCVCFFSKKDNHDLISLKLYQLTVLRSKLEEEDDEEEITVPSVDNMELIRSKAEFILILSNNFTVIRQMITLTILLRSIS